MAEKVTDGGGDVFSIYGLMPTPNDVQRAYNQAVQAIISKASAEGRPYVEQ